jgi:DNA-binding CsgD family transcriptional regulator
VNDLNDLLHGLYQGAQHLPVQDFSEFSLKSIKRVLGFDSATLVDYAVSPQNAIGIQALHLHNVPLEKLHERAQYAGVESLTEQGALVSRDVVLQAAIANRGKCIAADVRLAFRRDRLLDYCRKFDNAHSLVISTPTRDEAFSLAAFWRANRRNVYGSDDIAAATCLLPHLLCARQINQQLGRGLVEESAASPRSGHATILSTHSGQLHAVGKGAIRLLQQEWLQWLPPMLPSALMHQLGSGTQRRFMGQAITIQASVRGEMLCLDIALRRDADRLTPAEDRVARLAAGGLQYKEIAREIRIAPATVRNQLQAVYRKLGVTNKTALAAALLLS